MTVPQFAVLDKELTIGYDSRTCSTEQIISIGKYRVRIKFSMGLAKYRGEPKKVATAEVFDSVMLTWNPLVTVDITELPAHATLDADIDLLLDSMRVGNAILTEDQYDEAMKSIVEKNLADIRNRLMTKVGAVLI